MPECEPELERAATAANAAFEDWLRELRSPDGSTAALLKIPRDQRTEQQHAQLRQEYFRTAAPDILTLQMRLAALRDQKEKLEQAAPLALVWDEMPTPRPTHVLTRGDFQQPGELVVRDVPAVFPPLPPDAPRNRLTFARWLVSGHHPLTSRVVVNRLWKQVFGAGLVRSPDDLGVRGELPTHPELLDWLAVEFQDSSANFTGWDVKRLLRLIVTSAAYCQTSAVSPDRIERDPENRLLTRASRYRLSAEEIRDAALTASGLLTRDIGGRSVFPWQPEHYYRDKEDAAGEWKWPVETGSQLYRRGLYTFIRRTSPYPSFQTFDTSGRGECTVARSRTNTPLQALVTLNDPVFFEAARVLAERMLSECENPDHDAFRFLFRCVLSRDPSAAEQAVAERLFQSELQRFQAEPEAAAAVQSQGPAPHAPGHSGGINHNSAATATRPAADVSATEVHYVVAVAAWTTVANALFNLDEAITLE